MTRVVSALDTIRCRGEEGTRRFLQNIAFDSPGSQVSSPSDSKEALRMMERKGSLWVVKRLPTGVDQNENLALHLAKTKLMALFDDITSILEVITLNHLPCHYLLPDTKTYLPRYMSVYSASPPNCGSQKSARARAERPHVDHQGLCRLRPPHGYAISSHQP